MEQTKSALLACLILLVAVTAVGCGPPALSAVSGRVTLDGQPLNEAVIMFVPLDPNRKKTGGEVIGGNYSIAKDLGILPGKYRIEIADNPPLDAAAHHGGSRPARRPFPSRYAHKSPLTITFETGGKTTFDFEMTTLPAAEPSATAQKK